MTQAVTMPDGSVNNFPDEATPEMISAALGLSKQAPTDGSTDNSPKPAPVEADTTAPTPATPPSVPMANADDKGGWSSMTPDPVNDKIFAKTQPNANAFLSVLQSDFVKPAEAAGIAAKNALTADGPIGDSMIEGMRKAGVLNDYMNGEDKFIKDINEAILRPAAVALDASLRVSNAVVTAGLAGIGEVVTGDKPEKTADNAQDFANALYLYSGLNEEGVVEAATTEKAQSKPPEMPAEGPPAVTPNTRTMAEDAPPQLSVPVPKENLAVDESGNLNLKYINTSDDAREVLAQTAQAYADKNGTVVPRIQSTEQADEFFKNAMQQTSEGVPDAIADHMVGDPVNRMLLGTARRYTVQAADDYLKARDSGDEEAAREAFGRLQNATGIRHEVSAEAGRTLEFHKEIIGGEGGEDLEKLAEKLKGMTADEAFHATAGLDTPQQIAQYVRDTQKPTWPEMGLFYVMNNLLSGPITHAAYAASWGVQSLIRVGLETPIAAGIGKLQELSGKILKPEEVKALTEERTNLMDRLNEATSTQGRKLPAAMALPMQNRIQYIEKKLKWASTVTLGETHARAYGLAEGSLEAIRAMGRTLKSGSNQLLPGEIDKAKEVFKEKYDAAIKKGASTNEAKKVGQDAYNELTMNMSNPIIERAESIENPAVKAFVKGLGWTIGIPFRAAGSIHTFQKFASYYESRNALAFRQALAEGLKGDELGNRIAKLKADMPSDMQMKAVEEAQYSALIETSGPVGRKVQELANATPAMRFIIPFSKIPTNLIAQKFLERSPIGLFTPSFWKKTLGNEDAAAQANAIGKMVSGTTLMMAGAWLTANGYNNGEDPEKREDRQFNYLTGRPGYSIRIDDINIPHRMFGVSGGALSLGADAYNIYQEGKLKDEDALAIFGAAAHYLGNDALEENALTSLSNTIDAVRDKENYGKYYVKNLIASFFIPGSTFQNQVTHKIDPFVRQSTSKDFYESFKELVQARTIGASTSLVPDVDILGRPMQRTGDYDQAMNDPLIQEMQRLEYHPGRVEPRLGNVALTHEQFFDYQTKAGQVFAYKARQDIASPDWMKLDSQTQFKTLHHDLKIGRECARSYMAMTYPEITLKSVKKNLDVCKTDGE